MASRKETKEKEESISQYSQEVSILMCAYKGVLDHKIFQISVATSSSDKDLEAIVDRFVELKMGNCVFYKPTDSLGTRYVVYGSRLSEKEITRILKLKAFW